MQAILDTSVLIASERWGRGCASLLESLQQTMDVQQAGVSTISVMEFTHGIYRARTEEQRRRRRDFLTDVLDAFTIHPVTTGIAQRAGQIEGELAVVGIRVDTADLLIGATALIAACDVFTLNVRHFERIPNLRVLPFAF